MIGQTISRPPRPHGHGDKYVISMITIRLAHGDNTCEGGVEPTENIYKIRECAVARHLFSFLNSQNVVISVLSVTTLRVASKVCRMP